MNLYMYSKDNTIAASALSTLKYRQKATCTLKFGEVILASRCRLDVFAHKKRCLLSLSHYWNALGVQHHIKCPHTVVWALLICRCWGQMQPSIYQEWNMVNSKKHLRTLHIYSAFHRQLKKWQAYYGKITLKIVLSGKRCFHNHILKMSAKKQALRSWTTSNQESIVYHYVNMGWHLQRDTEISVKNKCDLSFQSF